MGNSDDHELENKDSKGLPTGSLSESEIIEASEKLSGLDYESKSMLFLLCLTTFNDLQNRFLNKYREHVETKGKNNKNHSKEEVKLIKKLSKAQDPFLNTPLEDEDSLDDTTPTFPPSDHLQPETSLMRSLWRRYRIELYIKAMLIVFLLKLPYFCYIFITVVYILYCFGLLNLIARLFNTLREHQNAQAIVRYFVQFMDSIEPLLLIPFNQGNNQQTQPQRQMRPPPTNTTTPRATTGDQTHFPRSRTAPAAWEQEAESSGSTRQRPVTERLEPTRSQESFSTAPRQTSGLAESHTQEGGASLRINELPPQSSQGSQPTQDGTQSEEQREKPTYFEKFVYQVFLSFILSLLPWWEPNPIYLEE